MSSPGSPTTVSIQQQLSCIVSRLDRLQSDMDSVITSIGSQQQQQQQGPTTPNWRKGGNPWKQLRLAFQDSTPEMVGGSPVVNTNNGVEETTSNGAGDQHGAPIGTGTPVITSFSEEVADDDDDDDPDEEDDPSPRTSAPARLVSFSWTTRLDQTPTELVLPDTWWRTLWNLAYLFLAMYEFGTVLLTVAVNRWAILPPTWSVVVDGFVALFFLADVALQARTARTHEGVFLDTQPQLVWSLYRRGWFLFDFPITIGMVLNVIVLLASRVVLLYRVVDCLRLLRPIRVPWIFQSSNPLRPRAKYVSVMLFVYFLLVCTHVLACLWLLASGTYEESAFWSRSETLAEYAWAVYWTVTTLSTVGYGDAVPHSTATRGVAVIGMVCAVCFTSYSISWLSAELAKDDSLSRQRREVKEKLASLLQYYRVPWCVQKEAFAIFPILIDSALNDHAEILQILPPALKNQITSSIKLRLVESVPLFQKAETACRQALAASLKYLVLSTGEVVVTEGTLGKEMYFLVSGFVEVLGPDRGRGAPLLANLTGGAWFGEIALLKELRRTATVRTVTPCALFKLDKSNFREIIEEYPDFAASIQQQADERLALTRSQRNEAHWKRLRLSAMTLPGKTASVDVSPAASNDDIPGIPHSVSTNVARRRQSGYNTSSGNMVPARFQRSASSQDPTVRNPLSQPSHNQMLLDPLSPLYHRARPAPIHTRPPERPESVNY